MTELGITFNISNNVMFFNRMSHSYQTAAGYCVTKIINPNTLLTHRWALPYDPRTHHRWGSHCHALSPHVWSVSQGVWSSPGQKAAGPSWLQMEGCSKTTLDLIHCWRLQIRENVDMTHHAVTILLYFITNILNSIFSCMKCYDLTSIIVYN